MSTSDRRVTVSVSGATFGDITFGRDMQEDIGVDDEYDAREIADVLLDIAGAIQRLYCQPKPAPAPVSPFGPNAMPCATVTMTAPAGKGTLHNAAAPVELCSRVSIGGRVCAKPQHSDSIHADADGWEWKSAGKTSEAS